MVRKSGLGSFLSQVPTIGTWLLPGNTVRQLVQQSIRQLNQRLLDGGAYQMRIPCGIVGDELSVVPGWCRAIGNYPPYKPPTRRRAFVYALVSAMATLGSVDAGKSPTIQESLQVLHATT